MRPAARVLTVLVTATTLALTAGCDSDRRSPGPELLDEVDLTPSVTVGVDRSGFDPDRIELDAGTPFELRNAGDGPHTLRIDDPFVDTGDILPGETTLVVLDTPGRHQGVDDQTGSTIEIVVIEAVGG